jgi:hypothetical protein
VSPQNDNLNYNMGFPVNTYDYQNYTTQQQPTFIQNIPERFKHAFKKHLIRSSTSTVENLLTNYDMSSNLLSFQNPNTNFTNLPNNPHHNDFSSSTSTTSSTVPPNTGPHKGKGLVVWDFGEFFLLTATF